MSTDYHLAQLNIGRTLAELDDPLMAGFTGQLDHINALADRSPGFVWRLQTEAGNATDIKAFDDPRMILNMSVWESLEALRHYVYRTEHLQLLRNRKQWFELPGEPILVLWWVAQGHRPDIEEALARLALLRANGPTPEGFTFAEHYPPPG